MFRARIFVLRKIVETRRIFQQPHPLCKQSFILFGFFLHPRKSVIGAVTKRLKNHFSRVFPSKRKNNTSFDQFLLLLPSPLVNLSDKPFPPLFSINFELQTKLEFCRIVEIDSIIKHFLQRLEQFLKYAQ